MIFTGKYLKWTQDPITYKRSIGGYGLIIGTKHYRFKEDGELEHCGPIMEAELLMLLKQLYPNPSEALVGGVEYVKDPKPGEKPGEKK